MPVPLDVNKNNEPDLQPRSAHARPGPIPDARLEVLEPTRVTATLVGRDSSSTSTTSCAPKDTTGACERYDTASNSSTLPIVLGVVIPLVVAFVALIYLHRRHVRKLRREDAEDRLKSLDFGIATAGVEEKKNKKKHNKNKNATLASEMSLAETAKAIRGNKGLSMDMGLSNPYLLPVGLHDSRESLQSLSRSLKADDDKYGQTDFIPDDGSVRSPSRIRRSPDDASSHTSSNRPNFDTQSTKGLLSPDVAKSGPEPPSAGEAAASKPPTAPPNTLLVPAAAGGRASVVSNLSSNGAAFRKSNDYLGAYIRGGGGQGGHGGNAAESAHQSADTAGANSLLEPLPTETDTATPPPPAVVVSLEENARPRRPERAAAMPRFETAEPSPASSQGPAVDETPKLPELNVINSQGELQNSEWNFDLDTTNTQQPSGAFNPEGSATQRAGPTGHDESVHQTPQSPTESFPVHDSQQLDGYNSQYWEAQGHGEYYADDQDYYDPHEDYADPYNQEDYSHDPRYLSMGVRPLPPDDPSENPEQRANRIRSFYKEYFDESGKSTHGVADMGYYEGQYPPLPNRGPGGRQRATISNGSQPSGPRAYSSASQFRPGPGGRPPPPRAPPKKRAPPPKALNIMPTPSKLRDDTFIIDKAIDFAPPLRAVMQRSGTPDSGRGGSMPFSPTVRAHVPLASSYDDLAVMPSPHMLRRSGTFTALDFAPPRFRANHDSFSDSGSIRSARSGTSLSTHQAIKAGAYRVSRIPKEVVGTTADMGTALKPTWDMNR